MNDGPSRDMRPSAQQSAYDSINSYPSGTNNSSVLQATHDDQSALMVIENEI